MNFRYISINKPKDESFAVLKILNNVKGSQKMMKKNRLLEQLDELGLGQKDNPLVELKYKGRQNKVYPYDTRRKYIEDIWRPRTLR
jgi:hypothetical protein